MYRKPTHTDQYPSFKSHHPLEHKVSAIRILTHRKEFAITDPENKLKVLDHIKAALGKYGYTLGFSTKKKKKKKKDNKKKKKKKTAFKSAKEH